MSNINLYIKMEEERANDLSLSSAEKDSVLWKKIRKAIHGKMADLRERNDNRMPEEETNILRGKIELCKEILEFESIDEEVID